jgi:hypothetical protein
MEQVATDVAVLQAAPIIKNSQAKREKHQHSVDEMFNEILPQFLADFEFRPEQLKCAQIVWRAIQKTKNALIEAGTGCGKSFALLIPLKYTLLMKDIRWSREFARPSDTNLRKEPFPKAFNWS